ARRGHGRPDRLHRVVDGEQAGHVAAGRVDVEVDVTGRMVGRQVQELGHDQVGGGVVDLGAEKDDAGAEQTRVEVGEAVASGRRLDDGRDEDGHVGLQMCNGSVAHDDTVADSTFATVELHHDSRAAIR